MLQPPSNCSPLPSDCEVPDLVHNPMLQPVAFAALNNLRTRSRAAICAQTYWCHAMFRTLAPLCQHLLQSSWFLAPAAAGRSCIHSVLERQPTHFSTSSSQPQRARNAPLAAPWTPTSQLVKRKTYQKRSRFLIQTLENEQVKRLSHGKQRLPRFTSGDILEVTTVVPEADRKVYTYKGICIAKANKGPRSWFKIYNVFPDVGGFVQHFPMYMPDLVSVKVVGRIPKAKRLKLYHILEDEGPKHIYQTSIPPPK